MKRMNDTLKTNLGAKSEPCDRRWRFEAYHQRDFNGFERI